MSILNQYMLPTVDLATIICPDFSIIEHTHAIKDSNSSILDLATTDSAIDTADEILNKDATPADDTLVK